jgi:uncharacterized protein YfaQ (DUF2300 family)
MLETLKAKVLAGAAGLALLGAAVGGSAAVYAQTSQPSQPPAATQQAEAQEPAEATAVPGVEKQEANEPALPRGGHADQPGVDVQHDFQGIE